MATPLGFNPPYKASMAPDRSRNLHCARQEWVHKRSHEKSLSPHSQANSNPSAQQNRHNNHFHLDPFQCPFDRPCNTPPGLFYPSETFIIGGSVPVCPEDNRLIVGPPNQDRANQFDFMLASSSIGLVPLRIEPRPRAPLRARYSFQPALPRSVSCAHPPTPLEFISEYGPPERSSTSPARFKSNTGGTQSEKRVKSTQLNGVYGVPRGSLALILAPRLIAVYYCS
jgi:hypothetical protein